MPARRGRPRRRPALRPLAAWSTSSSPGAGRASSRPSSPSRPCPSSRPDRRQPRLRRRGGRPRRRGEHRQRARPSGQACATRPRRSSSTRRSPAFLPKVLAGLGAAGVVVHAGPELEEHADAAGAAYALASDEDFRTEWYSLDMGVRTVPDLDAALDHIRTFGTQHTEVIVTEDRAAAAGSRRRSTRRWSWSTRRAGSPTAGSSGSARRSASRPRSCTPAARGPS